MFESLFKSMPAILNSLKDENVKTENVDVTTDEGIKKVRDSVYDIKGNIKSLRENLKDSWLSFVWNKDTLNSFEESLDEILEDAEKKYKEAHTDNAKEEKPKSVNNYMRPVLLLNNKDASQAYDVVDKYLEAEIRPRLPKDTTPEYMNSIKESLADFVAWILLNKY